MPRIALLTMLLAATLSGESEWKPLFDGKSLTGWKAAGFRGQGEAKVEDGVVILAPGKPMTGITWAGEFPATDYEIRFEAARMMGNDFFASITFPAGGSYCTWVTGGWGGDIIGLSSIDGRDASENETRAYFTFDNKRWYSLRLRVTGEHISAWIDEERVIHAEIAGREIGLRFGEMQLNAPLGFASYATKGGIRKIEYRLLK